MLMAISSPVGQIVASKFWGKELLSSKASLLVWLAKSKFFALRDGKGVGYVDVMGLSVVMGALWQGMN